MYNITHELKYFIFTDGFDIIHSGYNGTDNHTSSSQPFMILTSTADELVSLFYETYTKDEDGNVIEAVPYTINWACRFATVERAQLACDLINSASSGRVQIKYLKHPTNDDWTVPVQDHLIESLPESEYKTQIINWISESTSLGYILSKQQMLNEGWF